ncbi:MAG: hypothetical protein V8T86_07575 [Victivallis sp.]
MQLAAAPNLVPKASDFWEGTVDGNVWRISWDSNSKRYVALVLGAEFSSNAFTSDVPTLFPWELTEEQWGAGSSAAAEIGIEGSRFEAAGSDITGGYNEDYKRNTPANALYFSRRFGGKFANSAFAGANYDTYYIRRQTGTNSTDFREQGALKFITEHEGGPQWRRATNPNSDKYVFAACLTQRRLENSLRRLRFAQAALRLRECVLQLVRQRLLRKNRSVARLRYRQRPARL